MSMKFFHAGNANRSGLPIKFHLYEHCGTWWGVFPTADEKLQEALPKFPGVTEIPLEEYQKCLAKMVNLPENMRPVEPPIHMPTVGQGVPIEASAPKPITSTVNLEEALKPVAVEVATLPVKKVNPTARLGKHAVKRSASTLPTDPTPAE